MGKKCVFGRIEELKMLVSTSKTVILEQIIILFDLYSDLPIFIYQIESSKMPFQKSADIITRCLQYLKSAISKAPEHFRKTAEEIYTKFSDSVNGNSGFWEMYQQCIENKESVYHWGPVNSCGCERFFALFRLFFCRETWNLSATSMKLRTAVLSAIGKADEELDCDESEEEEEMNKGAQIYEISSDIEEDEDEFCLSLDEMEEEERFLHILRQDAKYFKETQVNSLKIFSIYLFDNFEIRNVGTWLSCSVMTM